MTRAPDHPTLCRAFKSILGLTDGCDRMLDLMAGESADAGLLGQRLSLDNTHLEPHHSSKDSDQRVAQSHGKKRISLGNASRSDAVRSMPKLGLMLR